MNKFLKIKLTKKFLAILVISVFVFALIPQHQANAIGLAEAAGIGATIFDFFAGTGSAAQTVVGAASKIQNLGNFLTNPLGFIANLMTGLLLTGLLLFISTFAWLLDKWVTITSSLLNPGIVGIMWTIMKNFVNLLFILILIVIAFATLFDNQKYNAKKLLVKVIIVALLVNFSLLIGQTIISTADFLTSALLAQIQIKDEKGKELTLSQNLERGFNVHKIETSDGFKEFKDQAESAATEAGALGKIIITMVFVLMMMVIMLFVFAVAAIMVLIRVPILWFLLILSPLAWLGWILPGTQKWWHDWWKHFFAWAFFTPIYIFFLMFGIMFIQFRAQNPGDFGSINPDNTAGAAAANIIDKFFSVQDIFFYIVTTMFMAGGLFAARKMSMFAGTGVMTAADKIGGGIKRIPIPGTKGQSYASLKKGAQGTLGTIKEQGIPGTPFKGEQGLRKASSAAQDRMQRALGFKPSYAAQKEFLTNSNKEYDSVMQDYRFGKYGRGAAAIAALRTEAARHKADSSQGFAYRKVMGELGQTDDVMLADVIRSNRGNPNAVVDFIKNSSDKGKLSAATDGGIIDMATASGTYTDMTTDFPARVELFKHIQGDAKIASMLTEPQFEEGLELFGGPKTADGANYLKEMAKIRPDYVANYNDAHYVPPMVAPGTTAPPRPSRESLMAKSLTNVQDIAKMPVALWGKITGFTATGAPTFDPAFPGDLDFQRTLYDKLRVLGAPRSRLSFRSNLERYIQESGLNVGDKQALIDHLSLTPTRP